MKSIFKKLRKLLHFLDEIEKHRLKAMEKSGRGWG